MILQDLGPHLLDLILLLLLPKIQPKNKTFKMFSKHLEISMELLMKTSKKSLLELDFMEDLMDQ